VLLAIWDHTVLPATRHKWTHPALTSAMQAGTRFTYPGGMEGWVDLVDLIAPRPGVEPVTFRSRVQRPTNATTKTTNQTGRYLYSCYWNSISQLLSVTCHMGSHSVTCHRTQVNTPSLTPARQAGTRFIYPRGMEGWVDLANLLHTEMVYPPAGGHPSKY